MRRTTILTAALLVIAAPAQARTFTDAPLIEDAGIDRLDRTVTRAELGRDLFGAPYGTAVIGHVDVYEGFPYLESRWFQVVSDPAWDRLLVGEMGGRLAAVDGSGTTFGRLDGPRGVSADEYGRIWVADTDNDRVLAFEARTEFDRIELLPVMAVEGLARPHDVAFSDGGTPFAPNDDRIYVADTGANRVAAFDVSGADARELFAVGALGSGDGSFAGPTAIAVGRTDGAANGRVYVADAHNARLVELLDRGTRFDWERSAPHAGSVTGLDTDHWGAVYAAGPRRGVTKLSADLGPVAKLAAERPRAFHVPFVNRTDHRDGTVRRVGQGSGLLVEEWGDASGLRLVRLGVEIKDLQVTADRDVSADFVMTDRARVRAEFVAADGRVVAAHDLGEKDAGAHRVSFLPAQLAGAAEGETVLRLTATSGYAGAPSQGAEASFPWSGSGEWSGGAALLGNDPNPFRTSTAIRFAVPASGADVDLRVFDLAGRLVRVIDEGPAGGGVQTRTWDGRDRAGKSAGAGIYFVQYRVGEDTHTQKVVLLR